MWYVLDFSIDTVDYVHRIGNTAIENVLFQRGATLSSFFFCQV